MNGLDILKALDAGQDVSFYAWTPLYKASPGGDQLQDRLFWGIASTKDIDLQDEVVHTDGLDVSYFKNFGFFNDDHKKGPENKIGEPTKVEMRPEGLYVEGFLYKNHPVADQYWSLMNSLEASGSKRRIGLSIEGKVQRRNGKNVVKAWVKDIAVTTAPVNTNTFVEILKAISAINKSMHSESIEKQLAVSPGENGAVLVPEDLDGQLKKQSNSADFGNKSDDELKHSNGDDVVPGNKENSVSKSLYFEEAVEQMTNQLRVDRQLAEVIVRFAFHNN